MKMKYNNNVHLLGKDIKSIQQKLGLFKEEIKNQKENEPIIRLENDWNIYSHEISKDLDIKKIFTTIKESLSKIIEDSSFSNGNFIFSFTIIYSLDNLANEKENIQNF